MTSQTTITAADLDLSEMLLNEVHVFGHADGTTAARRDAARALMRAGKLQLDDKVIAPSVGIPCYIATTSYAIGAAKFDACSGIKVRFLIDDLGASEPDNLTRVTDDVYGKGDTGILAFEHPNTKLTGWVYIEVDSKSEPFRKLYVPVSLWHIERRDPIPPRGTCSLCKRTDVFLVVAGRHEGTLTLHDNTEGVACPGGFEKPEAVKS
jgi:hypothetical protein